MKTHPSRSESQRCMYRCQSTIEDFKGIRGLHMTWFCNARSVPICDYGSLISGYDNLDQQAKQYAEEYVDEMFTATELRQFEAWLGMNRQTTLEIEEVPLPATLGNVFPIGAAAVGGNDDFLILNSSDDYDLDFEVWGYFDIRIRKDVSGDNRGLDEKPHVHGLSDI